MAEQTTTAFTVTKSSVELYKIRSNSFAWADITIDAHGRAGRISIASDYGDWQNYWSACGSDFKSFLASINFDYAAGKFKAEQRIDVDKSIKQLRSQLLTYRREEALDADAAREAWDELEELESESHHTIVAAIYHKEKVCSALCEDGFDFVYEDDPHFLRFWKELWPVLLAEFAREKEAATACLTQL